jgi:hypothetical protein
MNECYNGPTKGSAVQTGGKPNWWDLTSLPLQDCMQMREAQTVGPVPLVQHQAPNEMEVMTQATVITTNAHTNGGLLRSHKRTTNLNLGTAYSNHEPIGASKTDEDVTNVCSLASPNDCTRTRPKTDCTGPWLACN